MTKTERKGEHRKGKESPKEINGRKVSQAEKEFLGPSPLPFGGLRYLRLTRLPRHDRSPVPGGIDPRVAVYARSWDGHYTTTRRDRLSQAEKEVHQRKEAKLNETAEEWDPEESWWRNDNDWW